MPLRILGLDCHGADPLAGVDRDTVKHIFRLRMMAVHPDMREDSEAAAASMDVQQLVWARDVRAPQNPRTRNG